jgi:hypothetical protein
MKDFTTHNHETHTTFSLFEESLRKTGSLFREP